MSTFDTFTIKYRFYMICNSLYSVFIYIFIYMFKLDFKLEKYLLCKDQMYKHMLFYQSEPNNK